MGGFGGADQDRRAGALFHVSVWGGLVRSGAGKAVGTQDRGCY